MKVIIIGVGNSGTKLLGILVNELLSQQGIWPYFYEPLLWQGIHGERGIRLSPNGLKEHMTFPLLPDKSVRAWPWMEDFISRLWGLAKFIRAGSRVRLFYKENVKLIWITRELHSYLASMQNYQMKHPQSQSGWHHRPGHFYDDYERLAAIFSQFDLRSEENDRMAVEAAWWRLHNEEPMKYSGTSGIYHIRYEDLCDEPLVKMKEIANFLDIPFEATPSVAKVHQPPQRQLNITPDMENRIDEIAGKLNQEVYPEMYRDSSSSADQPAPIASESTIQAVVPAQQTREDEDMEPGASRTALRDSKMASKCDASLLVNIVYAHSEAPQFALHKGRRSVLWSREPLDGCDVYAYLGAFSYCGPQSGLDVLITLEPIVVLPGEYDDNVWQHFDHILTFVDSLAGLGGKFHKILFPAFDFPFTKTYLKTVDHSHVRPLSEKKNAICMISGNKASRVPGELYSKRVESARWFHEHSDIPFDIYGRPPFQLPNYRGQLAPHWQKFVTLAEYRYCFCFENIYHPFWSKGYLSEKMLDCLMCGTVPIYLGCYNIEKYVPSECFIDFRQFKEHSELDQFLTNISDSEYDEYIRHIHKWVDEGDLSRYSMHRTYDKLLTLADSTISGKHLATGHWEPGLAADHAKRQRQIRPVSPVWSWQELASAPLPERIVYGERTDSHTEDQAIGASFAGKGTTELDYQAVRHILKLERIKDVNFSLLPKFLSKLAKLFGAEVFVETGTFMGETANTARDFFKETHTIELGQNLYEAAVRRFAQVDSCHVYQGDSAEVLREILPAIKGRIILWLDAHFSEGITAKGKTNTPILEELRAINDSGIKDAVILIDDIRCFQIIESNRDEDAALRGYPSLQQVRDAILEINSEYELVVLGDVALIYPCTDTIFVSLFVRACVVSRLFDGDDTTIDAVFKAEKRISSEQGEESEVVRMLAKSIFASSKSRVGGHYRLWYGLILAGQNRHGEACDEFRAAIGRGCSHWRVLWYFAQSAYNAGQSGTAEKAARGVLHYVPGFEGAQVLLEQSTAIQRWFSDRGDSTLRLDYPLTEDSVVFDVGGYTGEWSQQIAGRYDPHIYVFEPVPKFYSVITEKFKHNPKVLAFDIGLFDATKTEMLKLDDDGSSLYGSTDQAIKISLTDIDEFLTEHGIKEIDLIKINVEGAEYPLLKRMVDKGIVGRCRNIQVQFHAFYPDAAKLRNEIRGALQKTHTLSYDYPFVWESWNRNIPFADASRVNKERPEGERKTILLSYPRSGNSWLRYCTEFLTKRLTTGYDEQMAPIEGGLGRFVDMGVDCTKPPIAYKRHGHTPGEKDSYDMVNDKLILLVRNYKECMVAHGRHKGKERLDKMFYSQTKGLRDGSLDYVGCLQIHEEWRSKKVLIYYEDLMRDPEPEFVKILELLGINGTYLPELMDNLEFHKNQSVDLYSRNKQTKVAQSHTKGDVDKLTFHSKMLTGEQKRGWDHHVKANFPDITDRYLKRYLEPDVSEINGLIGLVFSKNRAMQLDATLRSFFFLCKDSDSVDLKVLYTTSNQLYEGQYEKLKDEYKSVEFIKETNFKQDLMSFLPSHRHVLFMVDDNIFVRGFHLSDAVESLGKNPDAIGFSLRLGKNTTYCYMLNKQQMMPDFSASTQNILKYDWTTADYDLGYPLEVSSSVYRISDLFPLLNRIEFSNPNTLELMLETNKDYYAGETNQLLCYERSVTFCNPVNVVQTLWTNKSANQYAYSTEALANMFDNGDRINVEKYANLIPNACHQEVEFKFFKTNDLVSIVILSHNRLNDLRICLSSIMRNTPERHEVIVVDNASTDGALDYLRTLKEITLVENPVNMGCPPARNQAMALAHGNFVVFLDNDTIVTSGWLTAFIRHARQNPKIGLFGPRSNFVSGPQLVQSVPYRDLQGLEDFARTFAERNRGRTTPTHRLVGFCTFIRREVIYRIGAHDAQFGKFGFEDDDYTWRAIIAGFQAYIAHDVFIHHVGGPQVRGNEEYNRYLNEAWEIFKNKWALPLGLKYGAPFSVKEILSQPFDPALHFIPVSDQSPMGRLIAVTEDGSTTCLQSGMPKEQEERLAEGERQSGIKQYQAAEAIFIKLLEDNPGLAQAHNNLGVLYCGSGDEKKALHHYKQAVQLDPENVIFQKNLADFYYFVLDRVENALSIYVKVLAAQPKDTETLLAMGHICVALHKLDEAKVFYGRVLEINPGNVDAKQNLDKIVSRQPDQGNVEVNKENYDNFKQDEEKNTASHKKNIRASILILSSENQKHIRRCVESIKMYTPQPYEAVFIINGGAKGTSKWLKQCINANSNYHMVESPRDANFARLYNEGIKAAKGNTIVIMHDDVNVAQGWFEDMKRSLNSEARIGVVGPMTNAAEGIQKDPRADYGGMDQFDDYARKFRDAHHYRRTSVRMVSDFCIMFRRELVEKIGLFDESLETPGIMVEDLCIRSGIEAFKNIIASDVFVHHYDIHPSVSGNVDKNRKAFDTKWCGIDAESVTGRKIYIMNLLEKADELSQNGKIDDAVKMLIDGIGQYPFEKRIYHALSKTLLNAERFEEAHEALKAIPHEKKSDADENKICATAGVPDIHGLILAGSCLEGMNRCDEAKAFSDRALALNGAFAPALNLKGTLAYREGDHNGAEEFFLKAIDSDPGYGEPYTNLGVLNLAREQTNEALDFLEKGFILSPDENEMAETFHSAATASGEFLKAENRFVDAVALNPHNRNLRHLLIDLFLQQGKYELALNEIEKLMISFDIDDGLISAALEIREKIGPMEIPPDTENQQTVSLCMIVKDEEECLPKCLGSIKPVVDEMIIVNTGSTDRTRDIAVIFGAKVFDFAWTGDFSEARNFSLSKAGGDWIFVLDADEVVSPIDYGKLKDLATRPKKVPVAYSITTRNYVRPMNVPEWVANDGLYRKEEAGSGWYPSPKTRLFTNDPRLRFQGCVHELVEPSLKKVGINPTPCSVPVHHYGKLIDAKNISKGEEYYLLGKKKIEGGGGDINSMTEIAKQASELKRHDEAIELWQQVIELKSDMPIAYLNLSNAYMELGDYRAGLEASKRALNLEPSLKEAALNYATCAMCSENPTNAIPVLETLLQHVPHPVAMALLSCAYCITEDKTKGFAMMQRIKKMGFECANFIVDLSERLVSSKRIESAILLLEGAVESRNDTWEIRELLDGLVI